MPEALAANLATCFSFCSVAINSGKKGTVHAKVQGLRNSNALLTQSGLQKLNKSFFNKSSVTSPAAEFSLAGSPRDCHWEVPWCHLSLREHGDLYGQQDGCSLGNCCSSGQWQGAGSRDSHPLAPARQMKPHRETRGRNEVWQRRNIPPQLAQKGRQSLIFALTSTVMMAFCPQHLHHLASMYFPLWVLPLTQSSP